ncbi:MAG TPA: N-formylglutamate amidohydrolase [Acidocella sp.]|nr:N-formylglutamate amidohydrolase [Acidocella sp.]
MSEIPPYLLLKPMRQTAAVVLTSPHSGRRYDADFLAASRLDSTAIRRSEDSFVDELFCSAPGLGVPLLAAQFPRAYCDVNREPWELDPAMFVDELPDYVNTASPRVHAGLGTIARIVGTGEPIYAGKLRFAEAKARIQTCWQPFHDTLTALIDETLAVFGTCLVIDCHSMPSFPGRHTAKPDIILGDGHGTSCAPAWTDFIRTTFARLGLKVRCNDPYAGGYITRHYGCPREGVQAVQVEIARGLYMNERNFSRNAQFADTQCSMAAFLAAVIDANAPWGACEPRSSPAAAE